jgi:hypothetical protein
MKRRQLLAWGCTQCVTGLGLATLANQARADDVAWAFPSRFAKPDLASDEGGLWALMDREETRLRRSPLIMREGGLREYLQGVVCQLGASHCPDVLPTPCVHPGSTPAWPPTA